MDRRKKRKTAVQKITRARKPRNAYIVSEELMLTAGSARIAELKISSTDIDHE